MSKFRVRRFMEAWSSAARRAVRLPLALALVGAVSLAAAQTQFPSSCATCHGDGGKGGAARKLVRTALSRQEFTDAIRKGNDMMPPTPASVLSDAQIADLYNALKTDTLGSGPPVAAANQDVFTTSSCASCHGQSAMGGLGPPIAQVKLNYEQFRQRVREGKGMMPPTTAAQMSDADIEKLYKELQAKAWQPDQIPIAFKVGQMLTTRTVSLIFLGVFGFSFLFGIKVVVHWLRNAGFGSLWPRLVKLGLGRSAWIALKALVVDGFLVISLYRRNRFRWVMHGLLLYGFCGLILADVLMAIYNPARSKLPVTDPLKLLPMFSGIAVFAGVAFVMFRYKKDAYIDNGLTLGRDFLFVNLLLQTVASGFFTVWINRTGAHQYVMPIYIWHILSIALLIGTAPFTRFQHAFVVPALVMTTRLTEAVAKAGIDIGFDREPSPGRHHKSERIVADLLDQLGPEYEGKQFKLRYYP